MATKRARLLELLGEAESIVMADIFNADRSLESRIMPRRFIVKRDKKDNVYADVKVRVMYGDAK